MYYNVVVQPLNMHMELFSLYLNVQSIALKDKVFMLKWHKPLPNVHVCVVLLQ